jgi:hypothetical protein
MTFSDWANPSLDLKKRLSGNSRQRRKLRRARARVALIHANGIGKVVEVLLASMPPQRDWFKL